MMTGNKKLLILTLVLVTCMGLTDSVSLSFDYSGKTLPWEFTNQCSTLGGQIILSDTCYFKSPGPLDFSSAKSFCESEDAYVLSLATVEEKEHLSNNGFLASSTWLGLENIENSDVEWSDGFSSFLDSQIMNVSEHYPSAENCSVYDNGDLTTDECLQTHGVVCKLKYFFKCYPGWAYEEQTDKCYRIFGSTADPVTSVLGPKNVADAVDVCKKYPEGHLVSTFAGAFFISWHPFWSFLNSDLLAWIGIFYSAISPTNFVDDDGAILAVQVGWLSQPIQMELYDCTYYNKTEIGEILSTRLYPGQGSDCTNIHRLFMCEIGPHDAVYPGQPSSPVPQSNNSYVREQMFRVIENKMLENRLVKNMTAHSKTECAVHCVNHYACLSFNIYPQPGGPGAAYVCELNDADVTVGLTDMPASSGHFYVRDLGGNTA